MIVDKSGNISMEIYNMIGVKISENNMNLSIGNHMIMKIFVLAWNIKDGYV